MVVSNAKEIAPLQSLLQTSKQIQEETKRSARQIVSHPISDHVSCTTLALPPLPNLLPDLQASGLSHRDASALISVFQSTCMRPQMIYRAKLAKMLAYAPPEHHVKLQACFFKLYTQQLEALRVDLLDYAKSRQEKLQKLSRSKKPSFNHDYVPVLEKYFEYNAYPSAADRALIARKSMMTERQIEVWFQNHRNRSRKDGKPLARLRASDFPLDISFDSLGDLIRPESQRLMMEQQECEEGDSDGIEALAWSLDTIRADADSVEDEMGTSARPAEQWTEQLKSNPLNPTAPAFAYPAPYVRQLQSFLDETSHLSDFTFSKPTWTRQSSTTTYPCLSITRRDIDNFVDLFARLSVRESTKKQGRRRIAALPPSRSPPVRQQKCPSPAATRAITTVLCPGRHPAFIPSIAPHTIRQESPSPLPLPHQSWMSSPGAGPSKPPTSTSTACTPQSSQSQPIVPSSPFVNVSPEAPVAPPPRRRRKSPQLPRRVPGSPSTTHLYSQHQTSSYSSSPATSPSSPACHHSSSSGSRISSYTSSSDSRVPSSSSSSSSSTPTTPESLTIPLGTSNSIDTHKSSDTTSVASMFTAQNIADIFTDAGATFSVPSSQSFSGFGAAGFDTPGFARMAMSDNVFDFNFSTSHSSSIAQAR
ncbi:hypothetical protein PTI98_000999 [Pleurotus ostreatus]|nr:hypothetical protein PTI98_000999 [Pleurotus ostreatus]